MGKTNEPLFWFLFGAGGVIAALLVPVQIAITGIAGPAGWLGGALDYQRILPLVRHPLTKLYLLVLISLPLFHWAHRFRFTLHDLGLHVNPRLLAAVLYGSAAIGSALAVLVVIGL